MDGPGTITWEEFIENAKSLIALSEKVADKWELHGDESTPGQAYLLRQTINFLSNTTNQLPNTIEDDWIGKLDRKICKDTFEASSVEVPLITEHHILWSMSYGVPVLYFNAWKSDFPGVNPVSVEEAQKMVQNSVLGYKELSQGIHPIIGTPFMYLHPCLSQELLENTSKSKNKLVSWLSSVAPAALHLKLSPEYYQLTV